jgi:hypothetical protein
MSTVKWASNVPSAIVRLFPKVMTTVSSWNSRRLGRSGCGAEIVSFSGRRAPVTKGSSPPVSRGSWNNNNVADEALVDIGLIHSACLDDGRNTLDQVWNTRAEKAFRERDNSPEAGSQTGAAAA